jgi:hypothetical protein
LDESKLYGSFIDLSGIGLSDARYWMLAARSAREEGKGSIFLSSIPH